MYGGGPIDLLLPQPEQIELTDITHALGRLHRWTGATRLDHYSVAEHSCLVWSIGLDLIRLGHAPQTDTLPLHLLLHDAHEAYTGDISSPVQKAIDLMSGRQGVLHEIQRRIQLAIEKRFGVPAPTDDELIAIKLADSMALRWERETILAPSTRAWAVDPPLPPLTARRSLAGWPPRRASANMLLMLRESGLLV